MERKRTRQFTKESSFPLQLVCLTWGVDSHGLFDYQSTNHQKTIQLIDQDSKIYFNAKKSITVKKADSQLELLNCWALVRPGPKPSLKLMNQFPVPTFRIVGGGHQLSAGTQVRIGKVDLHIFQIQKIPSYPNMDCRFCFDQKQTHQNFFVQACLCKHPVHINCLRSWAENAVKLERRGKVYTVKSENLQCKICRTQIMQSIPVSQNETVQVLNWPGKVMILDLLQQFNVSKSFYILDLQEKQQIFLGRLNDCDIFLSDISVSRIHAQIKVKDGKYVLSDKNSKFGTMIHSKQQISLGQQVNLQVGRSAITFKPAKLRR